jgi:hypothetical protein
MVSLSEWLQRLSNYKRDGGVEGGYNELVGERGWFASLAAPATMPSIRRRGSMLLLACLLGVGLIGGAVLMPARATQQAPRCPEMLMDFECAEYQRKIRQAGDNASQRAHIVNEYALIVEERYRLCPVPRSAGQHAVNFVYRQNP